jgi:hypothetical protein
MVHPVANVILEGTNLMMFIYRSNELEKKTLQATKKLVLHQYCAKVHRGKQHCWQVMRGVTCRRDGCTSSAQRLPCLDQALLQCGSPVELTRRGDFSRICLKDVYERLFSLNIYTLPGRVIPDSEGGSRRRGCQSCSHVWQDLAT